MVLVLKDGQMEHLMKGIMHKARNMARASSLGLTIALILENSMTTIFMAVEYMSGQMEECTLVNGETTRWRDMEHSHGQMAEGMWESTSMI
jgi:hypothetical protein